MSDTSIRTPVWGVTERKAVLGALVVISIRTPAWGVTGLQKAAPQGTHISIRTPAWGVTDTLLCPSYGCTFQFAPPRGG